MRLSHACVTGTRYQEAFWYITPVFAGLTTEPESGLIGASYGPDDAAVRGGIADDGSLHKEVRTPAATPEGQLTG